MMIFKIVWRESTNETKLQQDIFLDCGFFAMCTSVCVMRFQITHTHTPKSLTFGSTDQCSVAQCNNQNWLLFKLQWGCAVVPFTMFCHFNCWHFFPVCVQVMWFDATVQVLLQQFSLRYFTYFFVVGRNSCYCIRPTMLMRKCALCVVCSA